MSRFHWRRQEVAGRPHSEIEPQFFGCSVAGLPKPAIHKDVDDHKDAGSDNELGRCCRDEISILAKCEMGRHNVLLAFGARVASPQTAAPVSMAAGKTMVHASCDISKESNKVI